MHSVSDLTSYGIAGVMERNFLGRRQVLPRLYYNIVSQLGPRKTRIFGVDTLPARLLNVPKCILFSTVAALH